LADSTGEILQLAQQLGADLIDLEHVQLLPCASPDEEGRGVAPVFASYVVFPYGLMVDVNTGRRFVNEWTDRKSRTDAMLALQQPAIGITDQHGLENAGEMIQHHMNDTVIRRFSNLTDLAAAYGLPAAALQQSIQTYNHYVAQKHDAEFAKPIPARAKPLAAPYYALRLWPKTHSTMGGVHINAHTQVLNTAQQPIAGLFAAGEVTGGVHGVSRLGGCAITECLVLGRVAGQQAALAHG
jgi:flavocytochrome c